MSKKNILFVSHANQKCGVYQFGKTIFDVIKLSEKYNFRWVECDSLSLLKDSIKQYTPDAIIYNYHPITMPWIVSKVLTKVYKSNITDIRILQIGIIHEITQDVADNATNYRNKFLIHNRASLINKLFDFYIAPDPTLLLKNPLVYKTGRLVPEYQNNFTLPDIPTIGSYGFGTPKKGFENIVKKVNDEFDYAKIRLNIPPADFGDADGKNAQTIAENCQKLITKPGIQLEVSHDFFEKNHLLDFLAQNSINVFLYEDNFGRGLSSAIDYALAVQRPVCLSSSSMFRHILNTLPNKSIDKNTISQIMSDGFDSFQPFLTSWTKDILCWEYQRILDSVFVKYDNPVKIKMGLVRTFQSYIRRFFSIPDNSFTWLRNTTSVFGDSVDYDKNIAFRPVEDEARLRFNRILDNDARQLYSDVIDQMIRVFPNTMSKKISEANVQQAFVLDTVYRNLKNYKNPNILCVGCYEDTASMFLRKIGINVEELDPMINYYLQEFVDKPTTKDDSYDIIFSTSVIEHDPDDESFIYSIHRLLAPGGIAIITCDYNDNWRKGDLKPVVDQRLYTRYDLQDRLIKLLPNCSFLDIPNWNCPNPDFLFEGKYSYAFASFVIKKDL
jgi:SAM-dependent methyltransferase